MSLFRLLLVQLRRNAEGQDVAEYAIMLAVILGLVVTVVRMIGSNAGVVFSQVASAIQRKQSEEALLRSEARYRSLVQSAVVGIYRATLDGRFLDVNPALVAMLGYQTRAELLSLTLQRDVFADPECDAALHQAFLRRGRFEGVEARWKRKDGSVIAVRLSGRGIRDEREGSEVFEVIAAVHLRKEIDHEWLLALSGVLAILLGLFLVISPKSGALALLWAIGAIAIVVGLLEIALGFRLKGLRDRVAQRMTRVR